MLLFKALLCIALGCVIAVAVVGLGIVIYEFVIDIHDRGKHP